MLSSEIDWHDGEEYYQFLLRAYDVNKARRLIEAKPREVQKVNVTKIPVGFHNQRDVEVDLEIPLILVTLEDTHWPIDGWHRIKDAQEQNIDELPCVILDEEESKQCQL